MADIIASVRRMEEVMLDTYQISVDWIELGEVFREVNFAMQARAREKGIDLRVDVPAPGCMVLGERVTLIHNVINNFVSNCIKFSHKNSVVRVWAEQQNYEASIFVQDTGIGMDQAQIAKMFRRYENKSRIGTGSEIGSGFGMPMAHYFITQYGGRVLVDSKPEGQGEKNHGTTFNIILPSMPAVKKIS